MTDTKRFRTRHELIRRSTIPKGKHYIIGLDVGYSGTKTFSENGYSCFPTFVKKIEGDIIGVPDEKDILYKDKETGDVYMVGYTAQEMLSSLSTNDTDSELSSRKWYWTERFRISARVALGIALSEKTDNRDVFIQTGLPASYQKGDSGDLIKALTKEANYSIKIGNGKWKDVHLALKKDSINIIPQPSGGLYSAIMQKDGHYAPIARDILYKNTLVVDIGFGTADFYGYKSRAIVYTESIDDIGMKEIMKAVSAMVLEEYGEDIRIQSLQHNLETGKVICVDEETLQTTEKPLDGILTKASESVFLQAMEKAKNITNSFRDFSYLIISGGTGEAWFPQIKEYLSGLKNLTVLAGNMQDPSIPFLYANVRGYYFYRYVRNK